MYTADLRAKVCTKALFIFSSRFVPFLGVARGKRLEAKYDFSVTFQREKKNLIMQVKYFLVDPVPFYILALKDEISISLFPK